MRTQDFAAALRRLQPTEIIYIGGAYIHLREHTRRANIQVSLQRHLQRSSNVRDFEYHANRCFIVAEFLDHIVAERRGWADEDLLTVAEVFAALLRDKLCQTFPDQKFVVEIVGAAGVHNEPLEVCVTFYRLVRKTPCFSGEM